MAVRFGEFVFDPEAHRPFRGGHEVHLTPTNVAEERVAGPVALRDGAVLTLGEVAFVFRASSLPGATATPRQATD